MPGTAAWTGVLADLNLAKRDSLDSRSTVASMVGSATARAAASRVNGVPPASAPSTPSGVVLGAGENAAAETVLGETGGPGVRVDRASTTVPSRK